MSRTLYIHRATASQVLEFLSKSQSILFNCNWNMHAPLEAPQTHNVYCETTAVDTTAARQALTQEVAGMRPALEWELKPDRI